MPWRVLLICAVAATTLFAGACGDNDAPRASRPTASSEAPFSVIVTLATTSGKYAANHDDTYCIWLEPSWTMRDADGSIVGTGKPTGEGEGTIGDRKGVLGRVISMAPDYRCELPFRVEAKPSDFYELEVAVTEIKLFGGGEPVTRTVRLDRTDTEPITIEFP